MPIPGPAVFVLRVDPIRTGFPQVFDSIQGAMDFAKRELGVEVSRIAQSKWIGRIDDETVVVIDKRIVFMR